MAAQAGRDTDAAMTNDAPSGGEGAGDGEPDRSTSALATFASSDGPVGQSSDDLDPGPWLTPTRLLGLVAVLICAYAAIQIIVALRTVLVMLFVALFLAFAMEPAVQWLSRRGWRRGLATAAVFALMLLIFAGIVASIIPLVAAQVSELIRSLPTSFDQAAERAPNLPFVRELASNDELERQILAYEAAVQDRLRDVVLGAAANVANIGASAVGVVFQVLAIALVSFYLVADGPRARQVLAAPLPPERQREMLAIWELAVAKTGGYLYSRVLLATLSAVATTAFLFAIGVPYQIPLGLIVGLTSVFIPVVGTYVGGIVLLVVALGQSSGKAAWVVGFLLVYQQIENYLLAPRVQARTMDIHPAVAFVSVLAGGTLLGAVGALLALPAAAIIQALLSTYVRRHELIDELADASRSSAQPPTESEGALRAMASK